jgi:hypothetical protein
MEVVQLLNGEFQEFDDEVEQLPWNGGFHLKELLSFQMERSL